MKRRDDPTESPRTPDEEIDEASEESFPASDPPSWDPIHPGGPDTHEGTPNTDREPRRDEAGR